MSFFGSIISAFMGDDDSSDSSSDSSTDISTSSISSTVAEVGIALQVVGAVTHDKGLMKTGGFMSLAGGVASALSSSGDSYGSTINDASTLGNSADDSAISGGYAQGGADSMDIGASANKDVSDAMNADASTPSATTNADALMKTPDAYTSPTGAFQGMAAPDDANQQIDPSAQQASGINGSMKTAAQSSPTNTAGVPTPPAGANKDQTTSWLGSLTQDQKLKVLDMAGKVAMGIGSAYTQEQANAILQQRQALAQQAQNFDQQQKTTAVTNFNAQPSVARYKPTGLINSAIGS